MNTFKTFVLMFGMLLLMMWIGQLLGGTQGMAAFFVIGLVMNFVSYWFSDKIVLAMYGAKVATESQAPEVFKIVRNLTQRAEMPMPKIYLMDSPVQNAFATGRDPEHAAVAVTTGILNMLNEPELTGVLGHELSHVKNRDILIGTVAAAIAGAISMLSRSAMWFGGGRDSEGNRSNGMIVLFVAILAPITAFIIQMAISRSREYAADASGAELTRQPLALASALKKLQAGVKLNSDNSANPATAHMFIVSPLTGESFISLFSTHPPIQERVKRLEEMASRPNY